MLICFNDKIICEQLPISESNRVNKLWIGNNSEYLLYRFASFHLATQTFYPLYTHGGTASLMVRNSDFGELFTRLRRRNVFYF